MINLRSIWATPEAEAWAKDLTYDAYLQLYKELGLTFTPLDIDHYDALYDLFDKIHEDKLK